MIVFIRWTQVTLYAWLIFYLSSLSHPPMPLFWRFQKYHVDLILHGVEYMILGILTVRAMDASVGATRRVAPTLILSFLMGVLYAASDEWHQHFVPPREASLMDWTADAIGVGLGIWFWMTTIRKKEIAGD